MRAYTAIVTCVFLLLAAFFVWKCVEAYGRTASVEDRKQRRLARRNALLLLAPGVMFLCGALFALFRVQVFLYVASCIGTLAFAFAFGTGLGENMRVHGGN